MLVKYILGTYQYDTFVLLTISVVCLDLFHTPHIYKDAKRNTIEKYMF